MSYTSSYKKWISDALSENIDENIPVDLTHTTPKEIPCKAAIDFRIEPVDKVEPLEKRLAVPGQSLEKQFSEALSRRNPETDVVAAFRQAPADFAAKESDHVIKGWSFSESSVSQCPACGGKGAFQCSSCNGKGARDCTACDYDGTVVCMGCGGRGKLPGGYAGPTDGRGMATPSHSRPTCFACNNGRARCSTCGGSKKASCFKCSGSGTRRCDACKGDGKIYCKMVRTLVARTRIVRSIDKRATKAQRNFIVEEWPALLENEHFDVKSARSYPVETGRGHLVVEGVLTLADMKFNVGDTQVDIIGTTITHDIDRQVFRASAFLGPYIDLQRFFSLPSLKAFKEMKGKGVMIHALEGLSNGGQTGAEKNLDTVYRGALTPDERKGIAAIAAQGLGVLSKRSVRRFWLSLAIQMLLVGFLATSFLFFLSMSQAIPGGEPVLFLLILALAWLGSGWLRVRHAYEKFSRKLGLSPSSPLRQGMWIAGGPVLGLLSLVLGICLSFAGVIGMAFNTDILPEEDRQQIVSDVTSWTGGDTAPQGLTSARSDGLALTTARLNLRMGPSTGAQVLTTIPEGASVILTGREENGWARIIYSGQSGWVSRRYLDIASEN